MADFEVGIGDPTKPKLTPDEEKRVDADHQPIVHGLVWSAAATGLYLTVFGCAEGKRPAADRPFAGQTLGTPGADVTITVTAGKPRFNVPGWGASLELPVDLGMDPLKQRYVMDWLIDGTREVLQELHGIGWRGMSDQQSKDLTMWLYLAANAAINAAHL